MRTIIQEFRPAIFFILKFIAFYISANLLYGLFVTYWYPHPDPITESVTRQSSLILNLFYDQISIQNHPVRPTTGILLNGQPVVSVFEGCNGLNVVIVFLAFILAFGPLNKKLIWFIPLGIAIIHVANLTRIILLFAVSIHLPDYLYFTHKYLFTAFIFLFVFLLWVWWILKLTRNS